LSKSQNESVATGSRSGSSRSNELLEANEQLVLAAVRAQADAESAARRLDEIARSAERDVLTGLPHRALLFDRFTQAIASAKRRSSRLALLFLDVDNFKQINDTLGHRVGDEVLKRVSQCLLSSVRDADTVSRHGGDEFLILLTELSFASDAVLIARKVISSLRESTMVGGHRVELAASIGISIYPDDGEDPDTLIDRADAAMYRAKRHRHGGLALHATEFTGRRSRDIPVVEGPPAGALGGPDSRAVQGRRNSQLSAANEEYILASLSTPHASSDASEAGRREMEFRALLAHERRNPASAIRRAASLLGRVRAEEMGWVQALVERQAGEITRLVSHLLGVARASGDKLMLDVSAVDLARIVHAAVAAGQRVMESRRQLLALELPTGGLEIHGDASRLEQLLHNLLDNASRFTPDGGEITLAVRVIDDTVVVTVSDSGVGIPADALPFIFEPFTRRSPGMGLTGDGLGIGLAVARRVAEAHGGSVFARSAGAGAGSQFIVTLPVRRQLGHLGDGHE